MSFIQSSSSSSSSASTDSSSSSSSSSNPPTNISLAVFGPKTAQESAKEVAEARRIEDQRRASEQEREIRRNENLRNINEQRQQTLGARRQLVFEVVIPDFDDVESGDEEDYSSDEDSDDESLIKIPRAATANGNSREQCSDEKFQFIGRMHQIQHLGRRRDSNRKITTDESLQWYEPEKKLPEKQDKCSGCWEDGCASTICYGICGHLSFCEVCANKACRVAFGENFYPVCPLCRLQTPFFKTISGKICRGNN
ncbi:unnamed protein product [Meloidogyne enterolobii]|uniref:Uncharacterized protein n=1 Tax=Meloidogyne enterolobii TaxID=390850 RepID=A0ACB0Y2C5_MELEN